MPNVTGKPGEVVLVIDGEQWNNSVGEAYRKQLSAEHPGLPQLEPMFDLVNIPYSAFSSIFKTHRNLVMVTIDKKYKEPKILIQKNIWAKPQTVIHVLAENDSVMTRLVKEKGSIIVDKLINAEINRHAKNNMKYKHEGLNKIIHDKFNIKMMVPTGYQLNIDTTNFMWISYESRQIMQGVLIFQFQSEENIKLTTPYLVHYINEFKEKFVPGENRNSHMRVEPQYQPFRREIKLQEDKAVELRGLWSVEGDFMGGPFIALAVKDEKTNIVTVAEAFVYAPQFDKRDYLREVEAVVRSLKLPKKEAED